MSNSICTAARYIKFLLIALDEPEALLLQQHGFSKRNRTALKNLLKKLNQAAWESTGEQPPEFDLAGDANQSSFEF
jgi:hypothetical protein